MAHVVDCTSTEFDGLTNPYTGSPIKTKMVITLDGNAFFYAPDTYSTSQVFDSMAEAHRNWSCVNGVAGCRPDGVPAKCAYTGEVLEPHDGCYLGGFDPTSFHTREEYLYYVTMRDGKSKYPKPGSDARVTKPAEFTPVSTTHAPEYVDGALEEAEKALHKSGVKLQKKTTVTAGINLKRKGA